MNCKHKDHYYNLLVDGKCWHCDRVWGLSKLPVHGESEETPVTINKP